MKHFRIEWMWMLSILLLYSTRNLSNQIKCIEKANSAAFWSHTHTYVALLSMAFYACSDFLCQGIQRILFDTFIDKRWSANSWAISTESKPGNVNVMIDFTTSFFSIRFALVHTFFEADKTKSMSRPVIRFLQLN